MSATWKSYWSLAPDVTCLNHGSFGPSPAPVRAAQRGWIDQLEADPMDFFVHRLAGLLDQTRHSLGKFIGARPQDLLLVDNATIGMNLVAAGIAPQAGDEILLTNHEYGAVERIWNKVCQRTGARVVVQPLPDYLDDPQEVVSAICSGVTPRTRLLVFSHITSPTAVVLPVAEICRAARERGVPTCIDGPHALAMRPLDLTALDCDYYCASAHKWLSAPFGSGFLYAHPRAQSSIGPLNISWGETPEGSPSWQGEFDWIGTRDPSANLSIPAAIEFFERQVGWEQFRASTHELARHAREELLKFGGQTPLTADNRDWYGSMVAAPIAPGSGPSLQEALWREYRIEALVKNWNGRRLVRVSCHLYNDETDIDRLLAALQRLVGQGG